MEGTRLGSLDPESEREAKVDAMPYPMSFPEGSTPSKAGYGVAWLIDTKFQSVSAKDRSGSAQSSDSCTRLSKDWLYATAEGI